jgi:integrase
MSADGLSIFEAGLAAPEQGGKARSLADVLRHVEQAHDVDVRKRREMCSALRKLAGVLGSDPASVSAEPRSLRMALAKVTPAAAGVTPQRWANIRSLVLKALKLAGIKSMPGRSRETYSAEWEMLRARLPDRRFQSGLSRLMSYCTTRGIAPEKVAPETFVSFGAELDAHSLARDPGGIYRDACKLWNKASATVPGWPQLVVEVPDRRKNFSLPLEQFPPSFGEDLAHYLSRRADPDVFSETYCEPARPLTLRTRRRNILVAATGLVRSGYPIENITDLGVLVEFANAKQALQYHYNRAGGKTSGYIYHIATLLKNIARHHVGQTERDLGPLHELCRRLTPKSSGLTEKNKACLRQFADLHKLRRLLTLLETIIDAAERKREPRRRDAVRVELALAIAIELAIPIRADNLAGLRLDQHIHFVGDRAFLSIPAEETKNSNAIEAEFSPRLTRRLRLYVERYRPLLVRTPVPWLFPGENGARRSTGGFSEQISDFLANHVGVTMTLHQFRHLAAKLYLDRHPDGFDTVRRLLGHKSRTTTERFYAELEALMVTKRYAEFLEQLLDDVLIAKLPRQRTKPTVSK